MDWRDWLLAAFAVYLLLEGMLLFLSPPRCRRMLRRIGEMEDAALRAYGAALMAAGAAVLFFSR